MFIHLSAVGHLGCFYLLAILNTVAVNICVQVFVRIYIFILLGLYVGVELLSHIVILCLVL